MKKLALYTSALLALTATSVSHAIGLAGVVSFGLTTTVRPIGVPSTKFLQKESRIVVKPVVEVGRVIFTPLPSPSASDDCGGNLQDMHTDRWKVAGSVLTGVGGSAVAIGSAIAPNPGTPWGIYGGLATAAAGFTGVAVETSGYHKDEWSYNNCKYNQTHK